MICSRCGSEFFNKEHICPRCGNGKPKKRKRMPQWMGWTVAAVMAAALIGLVITIAVRVSSANNWLNGVWEEESFVLSLNAKYNTFTLADEGIELVGSYAVIDDTLGLTAKDGGLYIYRFERLGNNKMRLRYNQDDVATTLTVSRTSKNAQDFAVMPGLQPEDEGNEEDQPITQEPQENPTVEPLPSPGPSNPGPSTPGVQTPIVTVPSNPEPSTDAVEPVTYGIPYGFSNDLVRQPKLYINTEREKEITDREKYLDATVTLTNADEYNFTELGARIRGRGNSSWLHFEKKPYRLKFDEKVDLLGMGANKDWVLLSNSFDETMLRYYMAFSLAHELGLEYTGEYGFVNVYINGEYRGLYLLTEQIEEGNTRVDINTSKTGEVDTGYLIEAIGNYTKKEDERYFLAEEVEGKRLDPKKEEFRFYIKSPDEVECTDAQYEFIKDYVTQVNEAIFTKDWERICQLVDVDSAAKMFLLDQVMLNNDMGYCFYLYKKAGDKLYFGPMWDYDQSCGGSSWGGPTYRGWETGTTHTWYTTLIEIPEFRAKVTSLYKQHQGFIDHMPELVRETYILYRYDFNMNNERWVDMFGNTKKWRRMPELMYLESYSQHLDYLQAWLRNRTRWIKEELVID